MPDSSASIARRYANTLPAAWSRQPTVPGQHNVRDYVQERPRGVDWEEWLQTHWVELKAMTTPQFIAWLDAKMVMVKYGSGKLIPPADVLEAELAKSTEAKMRADLTEQILREAGFERRVATAIATMDQFNVAGLMEYPVETMTQGLILQLKPLNLDVLPLYIVLMGMFPPVLWLMLRYKNWVMLGSVLMYLAARHYVWNFSSYPSGVWYFNPFTWQLLFVLGAWLVLGGASRLAFLIQSRFVLFLSAIYLLFALVMTLVDRV